MARVSMESLPTLTLADGRTVVLVDSGCDLNPKPHLVWLGQISPTFVAVLGDSESDAFEYAEDAIGFGALDNEYINTLCKEAMADGLTEGKAWEQATEGMLALNGGAEWIDNDDYGFWTASKDDYAKISKYLNHMRKVEWNETPPGPQDVWNILTVVATDLSHDGNGWSANGVWRREYTIRVRKGASCRIVAREALRAAGYKGARKDGWAQNTECWRIGAVGVYVEQG